MFRPVTPLILSFDPKQTFLITCVRLSNHVVFFALLLDFISLLPLNCVGCIGATAESLLCCNLADVTFDIMNSWHNLSARSFAILLQKVQSTNFSAIVQHLRLLVCIPGKAAMQKLSRWSSLIFISSFYVIKEREREREREKFLASEWLRASNASKVHERWPCACRILWSVRVKTGQRDNLKSLGFSLSAFHHGFQCYAFVEHDQDCDLLDFSTVYHLRNCVKRRRLVRQWRTSMLTTITTFTLLALGVRLFATHAFGSYIHSLQIYYLIRLHHHAVMSETLDQDLLS